LARQILGNSGAVEFYTQQEFDAALTVAKAEIMTVAIETSKKAVLIEREACADVVRALADAEDEGEVATALKNAVEAVLNRIPSQRH
jgi:thiazole synthase ThiGH ThiG subunit